MFQFVFFSTALKSETLIFQQAPVHLFIYLFAFKDIVRLLAVSLSLSQSSCAYLFREPYFIALFGVN